MNTLDAWVTIINQANDEIKRLRESNDVALEILEAYQFFSSGKGSPLGAYEYVHHMAEEFIRKAKEQS